MKYINLLLYICLITLFVSCTCKESIDRSYHYGYTIQSSPEPAMLKDQTYIHSIKLNGTYRAEEVEGKRGRCNKILRIDIAEYVIDSTMKLYCNKDLYFKTHHFPAGNNLLNHADTFELFGSAVYIQADSIQTGKYIFYLSGETSFGNTFIDSTTVTYN